MLVFPKIKLTPTFSASTNCIAPILVLPLPALKLTKPAAFDVLKVPLIVTEPPVFIKV